MPIFMGGGIGRTVSGGGFSFSRSRELFEEFNQQQGGQDQNSFGFNDPFGAESAIRGQLSQGPSSAPIENLRAAGAARGQQFLAQTGSRAGSLAGALGLQSSQIGTDAVVSRQLRSQQQENTALRSSFLQPGGGAGGGFSPQDILNFSQQSRGFASSQAQAAANLRSSDINNARNALQFRGLNTITGGTGIINR